MNGLPWLQRRLADGRAIDKGAVGGTEVLDNDRQIIDEDFAMRTGDGRVGNLDVVGEPAPDIICPGLEWCFPSAGRTWINDEPRHVSNGSEWNHVYRSGRRLSTKISRFPS